MNLDDYVEKQSKAQDGRRRRCLTCALDEDALSQVHAGRARKPKPVSFEIISKWLEDDRDVKIQPNTIRNHFVAGHHNE